MRSGLLAALLLASGCAWVASAALGCGGALRQADVTPPAVTEDGTVWWLDMRAAARGSNDVHVIMCRRGERPVCVRVRPENAPPR